MPWNQWQPSNGMGGNFALESVATFTWIGWQLSRGIRTRSPNRMERAALFRADGLPPVNRAAAVEAVRDFVAALDASDFGHYSDVLVYGSRVRDDWDEYSDIDVAVVVPGMLSGGDLFMRLEELTVKTLDVRWAHWRLSTVVVSEGALAFPHAVKGNSEFYRSLRAEGVSWGEFCGD